jgi:hypothetical protein
MLLFESLDSCNNNITISALSIALVYKIDDAINDVYYNIECINRLIE